MVYLTFVYLYSQGFLIYEMIGGLYHLHQSLASSLVYKDMVFSAEGMREWINMEVNVRNQKKFASL